MTDQDIYSLGSRVGMIEGRLISLEARADRFEGTVAVAIRDMTLQMKDLASDVKAGMDVIGDKVNAIETKLDREEGAREQAILDKKTEEEVFDDKLNLKNLRNASIMVVFMGVSVIVGLVAEARFDLITMIKPHG